MTARNDQAYHVVDVFADRPLQGNPLAVVPDADGLDEATMRALAVEFNLSETTFLLSPCVPGADCWLRSFTPGGDEVFGTGHNALGAWWWLARCGGMTGSHRYRQQIGDRVLDVMIDRTGGALSIALDQAPPERGGAVVDRAALSDALGLSVGDIAPAGDAACVVSTGSPHMLVELRTRAALARARPDAQALRRCLADAGAEGCYLYARTPGTPEAARARFFNPTVGILEDPATGSAAGPLGWLLVKRGHAAPGVEMHILQGVEMGRPSRLGVVANADTVQLRGSAALVASGSLYLT